MRIHTKRELIKFVSETLIKGGDGHRTETKNLASLCRSIWNMSGIKNAKSKEVFFEVEAIGNEPGYKKAYVVNFYNSGIRAGIINMYKEVRIPFKPLPLY